MKVDIRSYFVIGAISAIALSFFGFNAASARRSLS
jgi:hypothetical protein